VDEAEVTRYITQTLEGVDVLVASKESGAPEIAWGDTFFFYDPGRDMPPDRRMPFATIVTKDYGDFDRASNLDRPSVFRLNIGVARDTYRRLFGPHPPKPAEGQPIATGHDFAALDVLLPHPIYAPQSWICVLNPSQVTFEELRPLLSEAHALAVRRHAARTA
jgi:hypothetical protein